MTYEELYKAVYKELIRGSFFEHIDSLNQRIKLIDEASDVWNIKPVSEWSDMVQQIFGVETCSLFGETNNGLLWFDFWLNYKGNQFVIGFAFSSQTGSLGANWFHYKDNEIEELTRQEEQELCVELQQVKTYITEKIIKEFPKCRLHLLYETEV